MSLDMILVRTRKCDGKCCREAPRFPTKEGDDCLYRGLDGCRILAGQVAVPVGPCPVLSQMSASEAVAETCNAWPENSEPGKDLGGCCWRWIDNDD